MGDRSRVNRSNVVAAAVAIAIALAAGHAHAESGAQSPDAVAVLSSQRAFDIPAQPLGQAIRQFGEQAGLQIVVETALTVGLSSQAVQGQLSCEQALAQLLKGSGLRFELLDVRTVAISPTPAPRESQSLSPASTDSRIDALEEIVVSATKRLEPIEKIPGSVQALYTEQLERLGAVNFSDYARSVAGLSFVDLGPGRNEVFMRGVAAPQGYISMESAVGMYIDDVPVSEGTGQPDLNLFDIERVEVLRGPQSTLYGSASLGGTIKLVTIRPKMDLVEGSVSGNVSGTHGGGTDYSGTGILNFPIVSDRVAARVLGYYRNLDGFIDDPIRGVRNLNTEQTHDGRLAVRILASDAVTIDLNALLQKTELGGTAEADGSGAQFEDTQQLRFLSEPYRDDFHVLNGTLSASLGFADLVSSTSYIDRSRSIRDDFTRYDFFGGGELTPSTQNYNVYSFAQEVRLTSASQAPLSWIAGAYYNQRRNTFFQSIDSAGAGAVFGLPSDEVFRSYIPANFEQVALFGEIGYRPIQALTVTAGLRAAQTRTDQLATRSGLLAGGDFVNTEKGSDKVYTPKLNISYELSDRALVYTQAVKGFRIGGVNALIAATPDGFIFPETFAADSLWNYEIGLKCECFDRRLSLHTAAFYIDWSNIQVQLNHGPYTYFDNAGDAVSKGLEIEAAARVSSHLLLGGQLTYTDAKLTSTVEGVGEKGDRIPYVPRLSVSAYGEYGLDFRTLGRGYIRLDVQNVGTAYTGFGTDTLPFGNYTLLNMRVGIDAAKWRVALFARNLTDKRARLTAAAFDFTSDREAITVARPRTIGLSVTRAF